MNNYRDLAEKVSKTTGIPVDEVEKIYKGYWLSVKTSLESPPLKEDLTEEELKELRLSVNIPSLGKIACTPKRYYSLKDRFKRIKKLKDNAKKDTCKGSANVQQADYNNGHL